MRRPLTFSLISFLLLCRPAFGAQVVLEMPDAVFDQLVEKTAKNFHYEAQETSEARGGTETKAEYVKRRLTSGVLCWVITRGEYNSLEEAGITVEIKR